MNLPGRIWILWFFVSISIVFIMPIFSTQRLFVFLLLMGVLFVLKFVKSTKAGILLSIGFLIIAGLLIFNSAPQGVLIKSVEQNSLASTEGLKAGQIIKQINNVEITSVQEYHSQVSLLFQNPIEKRIDIITNTGSIILFTNQTPDIIVSDIPRNSLKTGLDISGGARALVSPTVEVTDQELEDLIAVSRQRFNVFGLSDVEIKGVSDLSGNKFMLVEVAGATPDDLTSLISEQGKFEAKIGDKVVFTGGDKDITYVSRNDATQSNIYTAQSDGNGGFVSRFSFAITLSPEAAQRHADITNEIPLDSENTEYLAGNLSLFLDDELVEELRISTGLKGQVTTQISIQGSGFGATPDLATADARSSMNKLQTVLISGSLPFQLEIVKLDTISPVLGHEFIYSIFLAGLASIVLVSLIIFFRYRRFKVSLALILTSFSEILIILGIASLIKWNLDLPSIAGILATIGTGVDDQIVIIDEARNGKGSNLKQRLKRAIFIVMSAYLTSLVSLLPLFKAGAGLFKGFAITTIIGITAGVFITRPAFAEIVKRIES